VIWTGPETLTDDEFYALSLEERDAYDDYKRDKWAREDRLAGQRRQRRREREASYAPLPDWLVNGTGIPILGQQQIAASWRPVDLGPILSGQHVRAEPEIGLARADGLRLLYPGKEHTIIGEMESGKSWFAAACVAAELTKGNQVVYVHFEEVDPTDTVERLRALGVTDVIIRSRFRFVGPEEPGGPTAVASLLVPVPSLVVLDGVNESMSLHGWKIRDEDGAAAYRRYLVKPCTKAGAAVLSADHVVKDKDKRDRYGLGSIHKGNALTGSLIDLENVEAFGRGQRGASHVFITKDRPGYLRQHGRPGKLPGKTYMGTLVVDDTRQHRQYLDLAFLAPVDKDQAAESVSERDADEAAVLAAVAKITGKGQLATTRRIYATAGISKARAGDAIERLVLRGGRGGLTETPGPNRARIFSVPASVPEDHLPGLAEDAS
jgi:hypothetical protein